VEVVDGGAPVGARPTGLLYFGLLSFVTRMLTFTAFAAWNVI
jgi:hypothetical protein